MVVKKKNNVLRWLPLICLLIGIGLAIYFKLYRFLSFKMLQQHYQLLQQWTGDHYLLASLLFMAIYFIATAVSFPGALFLTLAAGLLYGLFWGTVYVVVGATAGATLLFLIVRLSFGDWIASRAQGWVLKMEQGFNENAFNYLLFLRLVPVFPFWVVNIVPALLDMKTRSYVLATFLGIIPGTFVYVLVGNGLGSILAQHKTPNLSIIFTPSVLIPILALAVLSVVPYYCQKNQGAKKCLKHMCDRCTRKFLLSLS